MPGSSWKGRNYDFEIADPTKPVVTFRSRRPSHFIFEIESYSKLKDALKAANLDAFETPQFTAGGVDWALRIYPDGKPKVANQHVSLYLRRIRDPVSRPSEVTVTIKFFIQDQISGEYLVIEDLGERSFDVRDREWGIPNAISIVNFREQSNHGFVVNDKCTFGAEVYITSGEPKYSKISPVEKIPKHIFYVRFDLSPPRSETMESESFTTIFDGEQYKWKLVLYRDGYEAGSTTHHSLYMKLLDHKSNLSGGKSMLVNFTLRILNNTNGQYEFGKTAVLEWYNYDKDTAGYPTFMPMGHLFSPTHGYVLGDNAYVQVTFNSVFLSDVL